MRRRFGPVRNRIADERRNCSGLASDPLTDPTLPSWLEPFALGAIGADYATSNGRRESV